MFQTIIPTSNYSEFSFNLPAWSICAEMFFYLIFPLFASFIKISNFKYIWFPLLIFTVISNYIYAKVWTTIISGKLSGNSLIDSLSVVFISYAEKTQVSFDYVIYTNPYSRLFNFFAGVSIAIGFYHFPQFFKSFTLKLFLFVVIIKIFHIVVSDNTLSNSAFGRDFIFFLLAISLITLILSISSNSLKNSLRLQDDFQYRKFLILLGNSSYALYILQWPFLHFATMLIRGTNIVLNMIILLVSIVIMIGISIGAHLLIERPLVRRFKQV
jgi:peptidoglycan/LPS O-acetylase OafA/YrhL